MKAYIVHDSPLGPDSWGEGMYALITEKEQVIFKRWCTNRAFANHDLTIGVQTMLQDNDVTEVYSNGVVVWSDGKISKDAEPRVYERDIQLCAKISLIERLILELKEE